MDEASANPSICVKNKRLKMSPGGRISLPVSARKALGMTPGAGARVTVGVENGRVVVAAAAAEAGGSVRVSPKGMMELPADARQIFVAGPTRHYWLEAFDATHRVVLHAFA